MLYKICKRRNDNDKIRQCKSVYFTTCVKKKIIIPNKCITKYVYSYMHICVYIH